jgi:Flp pilus assembly protein TadD
VTRKLAVGYSDAAARSLWDQGRREEALEWFADAAAVGFDNVGARLNHATAAAALGRPEVALTELLAARTLAPHDVEPAARIAVFLSVAGRHRDAARWFEKAYRIGPAPSRASDAARAWMLAGDEERAREWRERAG